MSNTDTLEDVANEQGEEQQHEGAGEQSASDIEALAREMGWKPETEWKGNPPPNGFLSPTAFLKHTYQRQDGAIRELRRDVSEGKTVIEGFKGYQERAYERALREIEARQAKAVEEGDPDAYKAATQERQNLDRERAETQQPRTDPEFEAWRGQNQWYGLDDVERTAYADQIAATVARETRLQGRALFDKVKELTFQKYPEANNQRRQQPSAVEGGGRRATAKAGKGYNDLPAEDKALCDRYVRLKHGTQKEFLESYPWEG